MDSLSPLWLYGKCMSSSGGIGSPCGCSWGIKRLGAASHPVEGSGLLCVAACLGFNWLWWQWVPCRYQAECWSGVISKQPHPVILPVILKVSTVAQHGRQSSSQPFAMVHRCITAICGWDRRFEMEEKRSGNEYGAEHRLGSELASAHPWWSTTKSFFRLSDEAVLRCRVILLYKWIRGGESAMKLDAVQWRMQRAVRTKWLNN